MVENQEGRLICRFVGSDLRRIWEYLKHAHGLDVGLKPGRVLAMTKSGQEEKP